MQVYWPCWWGKHIFFFVLLVFVFVCKLIDIINEVYTSFFLYFLNLYLLYLYVTLLTLLLRKHIFHFVFLVFVFVCKSINTSFFLHFLYRFVFLVFVCKFMDLSVSVFYMDNLSCIDNLPNRLMWTAMVLLNGRSFVSWCTERYMYI